LSAPKGAAIDANDNLWVTSSGNNTVEVLSLSGGAGNYSFASGNSGYSAGGLSTPASIAIDESGNAWIANAASVTGLASNGTVIAGSPFTGSTPAGIAVDGTSDIWVTNSGTNKVTKLTDTSGTVSKASLTPTGVMTAPAVAIDGGENVWIVDAGSGGLSELTSAGVAVNSTGYAAVGMNSPVAMAIDGSGNVWVTEANQTTTGALSTAMTEFVGVAVPAITPISAALQLQQVGAAPGTPVPVVIQSGALPYYTAGQSYQAQLYATGGNSGTFTWSATNLPSGLTISAGGLVSGTTSVTGSTTVSVTAADAASTSNAVTKTFTLTALGSLTPRGNENALTGSYAVQFNTFHNNVQSGLAEGTVITGSAKFNGNGTVSGELDYNDKNSTAGQNATFTGYYTYGSDNRGTLVLTLGGASSLEFAFSGGTLSGTTPQSLRLIEFDDTLTQGNNNNGQMGSGVGRLQTSSAFVSGTLNQSFVFGMQGETPCVLVSANGGNGCTNATVTPFGPLSMVGKFTGNGAGAITFGVEDGAGVNTDYNSITMTGSYTNPDTSGRGTLTFSYTGTNVPLAPTHYVYYLVNAGEMLLMSSDGHASYSLLSGDALAQTGTFSTSTLSGNYLGWGDGRIQRGRRVDLPCSVGRPAIDCDSAECRVVDRGGRPEQCRLGEPGAGQWHISVHSRQ
jgi:hypothetical protein